MKLGACAAVAIAAMLLSAAPVAAEDPEVCHESEEAFLFACAGGGTEGSCDTAGYGYDAVIVATLVAYFVAVADSQCSTSGDSTFHDNSLLVGAGTDVASASVWWYESEAHDPDNGDFEGCLIMLRAFSAVGPLLIHNERCPEGAHPPRYPWGELVP